MFPEYREQISRLRISDLNFVRLFEKHNALDQKIRHMEAHIEPGTHEEIEQLKKEKLMLKDALYIILKKTDSAKEWGHHLALSPDFSGAPDTVGTTLL